MRRIRFEVAYDGTDFHGWQVQPGCVTIQGVLENVISRIEGEPVRVVGSGRTDAGVHALAQVAAVTIKNPIPPDNFRRAVNRLLPYTIRVSRVTEAAIDFHPRFHAKRKTYEYRIFREEVCPPFDRRFVYHHPYPLDEAAMIKSAAVFEGEHDFTAFAASDDKDALHASKVRTIFRSQLIRNEHSLIYRVTGSGFLKHMVRNMVGAMLEIGKKNMTPGDMAGWLWPCHRDKPGPTAPASGLFLVSVEYD